MHLGIGFTFINQETENLPSHLYFILSDPSADKKVAIVNATSWKTRDESLNDKSCVLVPGDHPFIKHKSFVYYRKALCSPVEKIKLGLQNGVLVPHDSPSDELINRVILGSSKSPFTPNEVLGLLREQGLLD